MRGDCLNGSISLETSSDCLFVFRMDPLRHGDLRKVKENTTLTPRDCWFGVDFRDIGHYARTQHNLIEAGCVHALGDRVHGCRRVKYPGPLRDGLGFIVKGVATIELALIIALILPHASATFRALNPSGVTRSSGGSSKTRVKKTIRRKYPRRRGSSTRPA